MAKSKDAPAVTDRSKGWTTRVIEAYGKGVTAKEVAERLGFSASNMTRWGKTENARRVAEALAKVVAETGCRAEWLVWGELPMHPDRPSPRDAAVTFARHCGVDDETIADVDERHPDPHSPAALDRLRILVKAHRDRLGLPPEA